MQLRAYLAAASVAALIGCSHDWDAYAPFPAGASTGTGAGGAGAGTSSTGGASSTSSSSGAGAAGAGGGGLGGAGGTGGMGGSAPVHCGATDILGDDFAAAGFGVVWTTSLNGGANIAELGGELVGTPASGSASASSATLYTKRRYDLRGDRVWVKVPTMVSTATTASANLTIYYDSTNYVQLYQKQGTLHFTKRVAGTSLEIGSVLYAPVDHLWWQFREDAGTLFWETSGDGVAFATHAQWDEADLFPLDEIRVQMGVATTGGETAPGEAHFDDLNGGIAPTGTWCAPDSLTDDFADGVMSHSWVRSYANTGTTTAEAGGELVLTPGTNMTGSCAYESAKAFDLTGNAVVVEVPQMVDTTTNTDAYLRLENDSANGCSLKQNGGTLGFRIQTNNVLVVLATTLYSPTDHRWWRIREDLGTLYWETAPDGKTWTVRAQAPKDTLDVTALDVILAAGTSTMVAAPGAVHYDNYNLPPP